MDRKMLATLAFLVVAVGLIGFSMVMSSRAQNHSSGPKVVAAGDYSLPGELTYSEKLERVANGVYTPEIVAFATVEYQNAVASGQFLAPEESSLLFTAYLIEGYAKDPGKVECLRALPLVKDVQERLEKLHDTGGFLNDDQLSLLRRISEASTQAKERDSRTGVHCSPAGDDRYEVRT